MLYRPRAAIALVLLTACAPTVTPTVELPVVAAPAAAPTPPPLAPPPSKDARAAAAIRISEHLQVASAGQRTFEVEPKGRVLIQDRKEPLDQELHLADVDRVEYDYEPKRREPHWVKIYIKQSGVERTRWRQPKGEWRIITSPFIVLPLRDRASAEEVVSLMTSLVRP